MKPLHTALFIIVFAIASACSSGDESLSHLETENSITAEMIEEAQNTWVAGLVSIGSAHSAGENAEAVAGTVLDTYYDYASGPVLFKPTLATGDQTFRPTFEGALSYFVGGNENFPGDSGFALKPYTEGTVVMADVFIYGPIAIAMSKITLVAYDGSEVTVDKTFAYRLDENGDLRIITHHSSLPFSP